MSVLLSFSNMEIAIIRFTAHLEQAGNFHEELYFEATGQH